MTRPPKLDPRPSYAPDNPGERDCCAPEASIFWFAVSDTGKQSRAIPVEDFLPALEEERPA